MTRPRERWVDAVKGLAILLVVACHGCLGLLWARLLPFQSKWWGCNAAAYCFHMPLFFLCSGYLWQRFGQGVGWRNHGRQVLEKAWILGVPYVVFATLSWGLKKLCAGSVNSPAGGLWQDMVVSPAAPFWFLPALFLLFALLPRVRGAGAWAAVFAASAVAKTATVAWDVTGWCFPARAVALHAFWFASGMGLALLGPERLRGDTGRWIGVGGAMLFLGGALVASITGLWSHQGMWWCKAVKWVLGVSACLAVLAWAIRRNADRAGSGVWEWLGCNTLPIFLMHTIFAAAARIGLLALGMRTPWLHVPAMLLASIGGPLAAMRALEWLHLDGLVNPRRWSSRRSGWFRLSKDGEGR